MNYYDGSASPSVLTAATKVAGDAGGGKSRPSEGKMYPRGSGK